MDSGEEFWKHKTLAQLSGREWEALCDGCGRCCLHKLQDADTGQVSYTRVACRMLDVQRCRCRDYPQRARLVPDCLVLDRGGSNFDLLPLSCAYRRLHEGLPLEWWHPLVSGDPQTVHRAGISVRGFALPEDAVHPDEVEDCLAPWIETGKQQGVAT